MPAPEPGRTVPRGKSGALSEAVKAEYDNVVIDNIVLASEGVVEEPNTSRGVINEEDDERDEVALTLPRDRVGVALRRKIRHFAKPLSRHYAAL